MTTTKFHVCSHCLKIYGDHAEGKCLYEPTYFSPVDCFVCQTSNYETFMMAVVGDRRLFACVECNSLARAGTPRGQLFNRAFMSRGLIISAWRDYGDY